MVKVGVLSAVESCVESTCPWLHTLCKQNLKLASVRAVAEVKHAMDVQRAQHSFFITDCVLMTLEPHQMSQVLAACQSHMVDWGYICKHNLLPRPCTETQISFTKTEHPHEHFGKIA